jgi:hypothetical protein
MTSFEAFTAVMSRVEVFWVVTPCSVVVGYHRFRGPCCLHLRNVDILPQHYTRRNDLEDLDLELITRWASV